MSAASEWAWAVKCPDSSTRIVLLALARRADNQSFECFPRQRLIAEEAQVSVATVKRALDKLVEMEIIIVKPRKRTDGSAASNVYQLLVNTIHLMPSGDEEQVVPVQSDREAVQDEEGSAQFEPPLTQTLNSTPSLFSTPTSENNLIPSANENKEAPQKPKNEKMPGEKTRRSAWKPGEKIPEEWVDWAKKDRLWTTAQANAEGDSFVDSALANRRLYADWSAAWRNWCRSAYCKTEKGNPKQEVRIDRW